MTDAIRVAIAEDSAILRDGLVQLLADRGFEITGAVSDPEASAQSVDRDCPTWPWSTSACRRPSPTRACGPPSSCAGATRGSASCCSPSTSRPATPPSCWPTDAAGIGYLLKDRVADVSDFVEALVRVASGGTALDPEVVTQLLGASRRTDSLSG